MHFVVHADEKLTAFVELESMIRRFLDHLVEQHAQIDVGR
jgi:hypothetical protein